MSTVTQNHKTESPAPALLSLPYPSPMSYMMIMMMFWGGLLYARQNLYQCAMCLTHLYFCFIFSTGSYMSQAGTPKESPYIKHFKHTSLKRQKRQHANNRQAETKREGPRGPCWPEEVAANGEVRIARLHLQGRQPGLWPAVDGRHFRLGTHSPCRARPEALAAGFRVPVTLPRSRTTQGLG